MAIDGGTEYTRVVGDAENYELKIYDISETLFNKGTFEYGDEQKNKGDIIEIF